MTAPAAERQRPAVAVNAGPCARDVGLARRSEGWAMKERGRTMLIASGQDYYFERQQENNC
jgi:hypothetical protein